MQKITRESLIQKGVELLENGTVDRILGWGKGEFGYDITPTVFYDKESFIKNFEYSSFCGANFSKYLLKETRKAGGKILVFIKPCDSYSFNQLLTEHRFDKEKVYAVGISCDGMADVNKIKNTYGEIANIKEDQNGIKISTLFGGEKTISLDEVLLERCKVCKGKECVYFDEFIGEVGENAHNDRFSEVAKIEKMTADERFSFWQKELSRCIRCNACRDVCPACTCEKCVFDNPNSGVENKAISDSFEEKMFHIIRAFHVAGRCTDCGECSRVCPQGIPLHLLNRKFIKDINGFYGEYQAGKEIGSRAPLVDYKKSDLEPSEAVKREEE